jgi:GT2 family glycosyltransferase/glycosyltransferase involved in cell wall biosynthesis
VKPPVKVAFASGTDELNRRLIAEMERLLPGLPLYVVSEFPPERGEWVPYHVNRGLRDNLARARAALRGRRIRLAGALLVPSVPYRRMRLMALLMSPLGFVAFNEELNHWMLRPRCVPVIVGHAWWRVKNAARWYRRQFPRRREWPLWFWYGAALAAGFLRLARAAADRPDEAPLAPGLSVVIPSRNGLELLRAHLPAVVRDLPPGAEIIVVDNGSDDGTAEWLAASFPETAVESSALPLTFARAVNRGIRRARYARVMLLNNDMAVEPGFFEALEAAFEQVPDLFCATAQIRFPAGARREETGKAVMAADGPRDFPVRCDEPLEGEDLSYVLYGSGGCSLYDTAKLRALGGMDPAYEPAYVEDLDLGFRAWQCGWPTVFVAGAVVEHQHRATTSRYFSEAALDRMLEVNYLRFLARAVAGRAVFRRLWRQAARRLLLLRKPEALREAVALALAGGRAAGAANEEEILGLGSGAVAVFPGRAPTGRPRVLVVSPYVPFPLSHGGAVRMYNLMRRAAADCDQVLVAFTETLGTPPREVLDICAEVVLVRRAGAHSLPSTDRPEVVEEFCSAAFRAALRQTVRKWRPHVAQLEFTQMAQYAGDCAPARTVLVEHDVTFDLYAQMLAQGEDWELRRQCERWRRFETAAWRAVDRVVVMSRQDADMVTAPGAVVLANGVDLERFRPAAREPEPRRLLFIGSFAHLPNLMALDYFLREVWPRLTGATLHVIAGARHEYYRQRLAVDLEQAGVELEGFVADVRPAYERAAVVIAPLVASAGTNIKIMEAMAMGKAIVSTPAGINGLDLAPGEDVIVTETAAEMAAAITSLFDDAPRRRAIEAAARRRVERDFNWDEIARRQARLYHELW